MHIESDRALIPADTPAVRHLTVRITAPPRQESARERPPANVSLVLDRSGSMDGRKIEMARQAVAHAIRLLDTRDQLAVVVYDDRIDTVLERTGASKEAKKLALDRLAAVDARGSTDLAGGWFRGAEQITSAPSTSGAVSRVLLLTDGLANVGIIDHDALRAAAAKFREQGIATSTFGVGADFDEELLASLATHGGGHFYFIEKATQIPDFFASELGETLEVVAREAMFEIVCGPGVEAVLLNDMLVQSGGGRLVVRLGDVIADQEITLALAITCAPRPAEQEAFADCRVMDRDAVLFNRPMRVDWRVTDAIANDQQPVNQDVLAAVADVLAHRAYATALAANRRGNFEDARRIMREMIDHLSELAPGNEQVNRIIERLRRQEIEVAAAMDTMTLKAAHYGTYALSSSRDPSGRARKRQN